MDATKQRGGKRPGAGRPPKGAERGQPVHVYLSAAELARVKEAGAGSAQAGIKRLIAGRKRKKPSASSAGPGKEA
jgi:hypothetical protein